MLAICGFLKGIVTGIGAFGLICTIAPDVLPGTLRNADEIESDSTRYLPSFTDEIAYITTKKANSSVMKSA